MPHLFIDFSKLNSFQLYQYRTIVQNAFPELIHRSQIIKEFWGRVEEYFPSFQQYLIGDKDQVIGLINCIPFYWNDDLRKLPREGWDWMLIKGINDYESVVKPNSLGGLQIILEKNHLGIGICKVIIEREKWHVRNLSFDHFVKPIRPTFKRMHPNMPMVEYMTFMQNGKIYDPWIRTHLKSGTGILNVCDKAMHVFDDLSFWNDIMQKDFTTTGTYLVKGALNPVHIDVEADYGEYYEDNIWISYTSQLISNHRSV